MKKSLFVIMLSLPSLLISPAFAYISGKVTVEENLVYCPEQISCTEVGNPKSCKYTAGDTRYWNKVGGSNEAPERAGVYKLVNVAAGYHWPSQGGAVACIYENIDSGISKTIALYAKFESNLEAYYNKTTKWDISDKGYPFPAYCRSGSPQSCPLVEQSALEIFNNYDKDELVARANQLLITDQIPSNVDLPSTSNPGYGKIVYENAIAACGSSTKDCKIDIFSMSGALVGSVLVDMDNKMKILKIIPSEASGLPEGVEIKKIEPFNTININKSNEPAPIVSSIDVYNYINSSIFIPGLGAITRHSSGKLFSDRASSHCSIPEKCTLEIKTSNGGILGSITINIKNNMSISQATSQRDSEIVINQTSPNSVEVKYPSFN